MLPPGVACFCQPDGEEGRQDLSVPASEWCTHEFFRIQDTDVFHAAITVPGDCRRCLSFRDANLTKATIICGGRTAFVAVDIDNAKFEGANLTAIHAENLRSSYFASPPTYNSQTQFPAGFDPVNAGWRLNEKN